MNKSEMEEHSQKYTAIASRARTALQESRVLDAIAAAVESLEFVDGMMRYREKYEAKEFASVGCIELIIRWAPLVFDEQSLGQLERVLRSQRRIDRNASDDLAEKTTDARSSIADVYRLWKLLDENPGLRQDQLRSRLGGDQDAWRAIVEAWESIGLVIRVPESGSYRLYFASDLRRRVLGKCHRCGATSSEPMVSALNRDACDACGHPVPPALVADTPFCEQVG